MDIYIIGSGTAVPVEGNSPAGIVIIQESLPILIDIGPGTLSRLQFAKLSYSQLDILLLSHLHPDHTLDLASLFQVFDSNPQAQRLTPFTIYGCRGTREFIDRLFVLYPAIIPQTYSVAIKELYRDDFRAGNLQATSAPSGHTPDSISLRLHDGKHSLVYSGDASSQGDLIRLAEDADILISECSFPEGWDTPDHLNSESIGKIAQQAGVRKLVLTHRYPPALAVNLADQVKKYYQGEVILASDGMHFSL